MLSAQIFRTIQSGKREEWYYGVTNAALYMATGGFLDEANELLQSLWKYKLPHDRDTWLPDLAFQVLWHAANKKPAYIPFNLLDIDSIEINHRAYSSGDSYRYKMPEVQWLQLEGKDAFRQGSIHASLKDGEFPDAEREQISLQLLEKSLEKLNGLANYEICAASSLAAELAARNNNMGTAEKMAKVWAFHYKENYLGYNFPVMACNRHVAPLLLDGILAGELKIDKIKCREFVEKTIVAIDKRIKNGPTLVYAALAWKELLTKLTELSIKKYPEDFTNEQIKNNWIGYLPASDSAIAQAEKKLKCNLPEDYKAFLKASNGFSQFPFLSPALLPVAEIDYLEENYKKNNQADSFEILKDYPDEEEGNIGKYLERAILISRAIDEIEIWMIRPSAEDDTWQCWYFDKYGGRRHKSFRYFIEEAIQNLDEE